VPILVHGGDGYRGWRTTLDLSREGCDLDTGVDSRLPTARLERSATNDVTGTGRANAERSHAQRPL
jgi:hypothetical protein